MKKIIYTCPYVPAEWIAAHGLRPSRVIPNLANSTSAIAQRQGVCPYVRGFINVALEEESCGIVVTTVCDQMRRGYDILVRGCEVSAFLMNVPNTWQNVGAQKLYIDELKRLSRFLVRLGGEQPSNEILIKTMLEYDTARISILEKRGSLPARQFAEIIAEFGRDGPDGIVNNRAVSQPSIKGVPLAIVGGPLMMWDFDILESIEQSGGRIVLNATETCERGMCAPFDCRRLNDEPLMELANAYLGSIQDASRRPNSELYKWLKNEFKSRGVRGIIFHRYIWCDIWHAELQKLKDWIDLPVLDIDSTGDNQTHQQRSANRVHAFLEMLQ